MPGSTAPVQLYNLHSMPIIHPLSTTPVSPTREDTPTEPTLALKSLSNHRLCPAFTAKYTLGQELGSGGFGFVVSAYERRTGIERAVKFIYRNKVPASAWVRDPVLGPVPMEIYVLRNVRHENIVQFIDCFQDDTYFYLVMELHGNEWTSAALPAHPAADSHAALPSPPLSPASTSLSEPCSDNESDSDASYFSKEPHMPALSVRRTSCDLFECIEQHHHLEEPVARTVFRQIVECVAYLDNLGICHRDIKDENIVIDSNYKVKLIDFGSAVLLPRHRGQRKTGLFNKFYGTVSFASPEILLSKPYRAEPAEIWALGVLLYTMVFGEMPFSDPSMAIAARFTKPKVRVSVKCLHLIACMLERSPDKRPTIHQVLSHPWFRG